MAIRIASQTAPCKGDSAIRFTTYPLMRWTSSCLAKKPEAISDSYCSRRHAVERPGDPDRGRRLGRHRRERGHGIHSDRVSSSLAWRDGPQVSMTRRYIH